MAVEQESRGNLYYTFFNVITYCLQSYVNTQASFLDWSFCRTVEGASSSTTRESDTIFIVWAISIIEAKVPQIVADNVLKDYLYIYAFQNLEDNVPMIANFLEF